MLCIPISFHFPIIPSISLSVSRIIDKVRLFSKKCTGRYLKVRDDDLSSKQGSLCTVKMIIIKNFRKYFKVYIYYYIWAIAHRSIPQTDRRNKGYLDLSFIR